MSSPSGDLHDEVTEMSGAAAKTLDPTRLPTADELPCDDGEPMETRRHVSQMNLLIESLNLGWKGRDDFFVGGNMFMYFSLAQPRRNDFRGPDVFVVLDTERRERKSWVVWEEGGRTPNVIIELLSESTEAVDRGEKMDIYAKRLHVSEYFLFDPWTKLLEGYRMDPASRSWRPIAADDKGWLQSEQLRLQLGILPGRYDDIETEWLRWIDESGRPLPLWQEVAEQKTAKAAEETRRADEQQQRADEQQHRADALLAELAALKQKLGSTPSRP